jgi:hypothetical protein
MSEFTELEYKYKADEVRLVDFKKLMAEMPVKESIHCSSFDYYYVAETPEEFVRFRESTTPELTKKRKIKTSNNWERVEIDLPLDPNRIKKETVDKFLAIDGHTENFRIFKNCFIFWLDFVNFVYYTVCDENMNEVGRFIEVEFNKEKLNSLSITEAFEILDYNESQLRVLGIIQKNRLKKSLFEMFYKEKK